MGFNNGYDAGWQDCETQNRAKWEKAAAEKALANAPSAPAPAPALDLGLLADYDVEKLFSATAGTLATYLATLSNVQLGSLVSIIGPNGSVSLAIDAAYSASND